MTDSRPGGQAGKRERLVGAAREVVHRQGVEKTTLADIAQAANVPIGNVYYYFKTKDELIEAAIENQHLEVEAMLKSFERHRTPQSRLKAFIKELCGHADEVARYGCPLGSLCSELDKRGDSVERSGALLLKTPLLWLQQQFVDLGRPDAGELAIALMAAYQGTALLANTFRDPRIMTTEARRLERWIDSLA